MGYQPSRCPNCGNSGMDYDSMNYDMNSEYEIFREHGFSITQMYKY